MSSLFIVEYIPLYFVLSSLCVVEMLFVIRIFFPLYFLTNYCWQFGKFLISLFYLTSSHRISLLSVLNYFR